MSKLAVAFFSAGIVAAAIEHTVHKAKKAIKEQL